VAKKYIVDLQAAEKAELIELTDKGRPGARKIKRANILLLAAGGKTDREIAELLHTSWLTVLRTRRKFVEGGLEFALNERSRAGRLPKIDAKVETILTTLAQSQPPAGRVRWTLQLLADRLVALTHLDSLSYEAVRLVLKKTISSPGSGKNGASPPSSAPGLSGGWKRSWTCMRNRLTRPSQWSALTKSPIR
jgi:transposase